MKRKIFAAAMGLALLSPVVMAQTEATDTMSVEGMRNETDYGEGDVDDIIKYDRISCKNYGIRFGIGLTY